MSLNVAIACGGTGGHLFPGLAVGEALLARGHHVLIFISEKQIDAVAMEGREEFRIEKLRSMGMPSPFSPAIFAFLSKCAKSYGQCRQIYADFQPHAVLGMGGFTSSAPIIAGRRSKAKTFVHDSNAIPGKANKFTARFCDAVFVGFEECARFFPKKTTRTTGTPIREMLRQPVDRQEVLEKFALRPDAKTILIMGGSQGAHGINVAVARALPSLKQHDVQFIHLTGLKEDAFMRDAYAENGVTAHVAAFYQSMQEFYSIADLAIARSGAASLTELSHFGIPSILIPYPYAAEDHQTLNARIFVRGKAAELVQEKEITGDKLAGHLTRLLENPDQLRQMRAHMQALAPKDAASTITQTIEEFCQ